MGTYYDEDGYHWLPLKLFPWVEWSYGLREKRGVWRTAYAYRRAPKVIEETMSPDGNTMQTIRLADGREQVRMVCWR